MFNNRFTECFNQEMLGDLRDILILFFILYSFKLASWSATLEYNDHNSKAIIFSNISFSLVPHMVSWCILLEFGSPTHVRFFVFNQLINGTKLEANKSVDNKTKR
ncbi:hypothetical protein O6H91_11G085900 [Diphasiastrum complanatum]|uniref:Uncharacterized protein n=1 Tax=Diphasiastrum complanatum TaxID=34168 RepID=A0ACC2CBG2_DIPCM|nr:hypothetical protein O6H91_11G085900 [Diphasiastrum complanatum]